VRSLSKYASKLDQPRESTEFLRAVNVIDFLEHLEIANISQATADEVQFSCPYPGHLHGDERPSAYMNDGTKNPRLTTVWKCHGCGRSGNAISFLADHEGISRIRSATWLKEHYAPGFAAPKGGIATEFDKAQERSPEPLEGLPRDLPTLEWEMYHKRFGVDWGYYAEEYGDEPDVGYMLGRGFTPAFLEEWAIGYDPDSARLTIPVSDKHGNLVGIKGRAWRKDAKPKYLILGDTPRTLRIHGERYGFVPYDKSHVIFGMDKLIESGQEQAVYCEGEIEVMSFWRCGIPAIAGGSSLSDAQARIIREHCSEVVLFLDNDTAGSHGIWGWDDEDGDHHPGAIEKLEPYIAVRVVRRHMLDANQLLKRGRFDRIHELVGTAQRSFVVDFRSRL
jgi:hypothetical protein